MMNCKNIVTKRNRTNVLIRQNIAYRNKKDKQNNESEVIICQKKRKMKEIHLSQTIKNMCCLEQKNGTGII